MIRGAIYGLAAAAIWGGMYVVSDVVLKTIPPFSLLTMRLLLGIATLTVIVWRTGTKLPAGPDLLRALGVGIVGFGVSIGAQFVGTDKSNALNGTLVTSASPAFILVFAALILREKLTVQRIAAVTLATIGVVVIVDPGQADFGSDTFAGNVILALAAVTWGLYSVLVRHVSARLETLMVTLLALVGGLILTVPAAVLELRQRPIGEMTLWIILGILYLGVMSTAAATWLWNRAFALVDASVASLFFFAQPLVGAFLSAFLGQEMTPALWIGSGLIVVGVLLALYPVKQRPIRRAAARSEIAD
jgi:drug/metabolite transporter (DMT)-like permease